jgi:hypothetical protein
MSSVSTKIQEEVGDHMVSNQPGGLATVLQIDPYKRQRMLVPVRKINLLTQVRGEYDDEGIAELGNDIAGSVEQHPANIAVKDAKGAVAYLKLVNELWGSDWQLSELTPLPGKKRLYAIVISGHRRTLAKRYIWENGCDQCLEQYGSEPEGQCFGRHFRHGGDLVEVFGYRQVTPELAIGMQLRENIRQNVPPQRQAQAYDQLFALMHRDDPSLSVARFAREIGKVSPETVRKARRFCRLPQSVQRDVGAGLYSYSIALELGRLRDRLDLTADEIEAERARVSGQIRSANEVRADKQAMIGAQLSTERVRIVADGLTHRQYKAFVDKQIHDATHGGVLFGLAATAQAETTHRRAVFEQKTLMALHGYNRYFRKVLPLLQDGTIGPDGEFSEEPARRLLRENLGLLQSIVPLLQKGDVSDDMLRQLAGLEFQLQELQAVS